MGRGPISAGAARAQTAVFGGKENDIQLWDLTTQGVMWKAKNVSNDKLSLRVPIYVTAVKYLGSDNAVASRIITGTGYKQIRIYDTKSKRQPVVDFSIGGEEAYRITALAPTPDGRAVYISDTTGGLFLWDIGTRKRINTLPGSYGATRDLQMDPDGNYIASVGLDRY